MSMKLRKQKEELEKKRVVEEKQQGDLIAELEITSDLWNEFNTQPTSFSKWAYLRARALDEVRKYEELEKIKFYELYAEAKEELGSSSKENECKAFIFEDSKYRKILSLRREAKRQRDILTAACDAFAMKAQMLQQLGPMVRKELEQVLAGAPKNVARRSIMETVTQGNELVKAIAAGKKQKKEQKDG